MSQKPFKPFKFASFSSIQDKNIRKLAAPGSAPAWRVIKKGLNLTGTCKNEKCVAYDQSVQCILGYGNFNIAEWIRKAPCSQCQMNLKNVQGAIIYDCLLTGKGQKIKEGDETDDDDHEGETCFEYEIHGSDQCLSFGNLAKQIITWNYLALKATKCKNKCPQTHKLQEFKTVEQKWACNICEKKYSKTESASSCKDCKYHKCFDCI